MLAAWLKNHFSLVWRCVFLCCAAPGVYLLAMVAWDELGPNPLTFLLHHTGRSALVILTITLAITPLRRWLANLSKLTHRRYGKRLADWNWLVRLRRQLGLWCFVYALAHGWIYAAFDLGYDWASAWAELLEKPYLAAGALGLLLLVPLAATSTQAMMRRLGRNWGRLHMLTYAVACAGLLHFWWMMKPGLWSPWPDTLVLSVLLGYRLLLRTGLLERWDGFDGKESAER
jgi:methionine sulfoxide reductase heme-binding subunit